MNIHGEWITDTLRPAPPPCFSITEHLCSARFWDFLQFKQNVFL